MTNDLYLNRPAHLRSPEAWEEYQQECRERNEQARQRHLAALEEERKQQRAKVEARLNQEAEAAIASYKLQARTAFPGTGAQFDAAWPEILRRWQIAQVESGQNDIIARKRAQYGDVI